MTTQKNQASILEATQRHLDVCTLHDDARAASYAIVMAALLQCRTHGHSMDAILATVREKHGAAIDAAAKTLVRL